MTQHELLLRMSTALDELKSTLDSEAAHASVDLGLVLDAYARCHQELARSLRRLADGEVCDDIEVLAGTAAAVDQYLNARLGDAVPAKYLTIGNPGRTRAALLAYLLNNSGRPVSAARLRAICGEQTHTERRVRELRDYGYRVDSGVRSGETCYILADEPPDTVGAAWRIVERKVQSDRQLPDEIRRSLGMIIRERKAHYLPADQVRWASTDADGPDPRSEGE